MRLRGNFSYVVCLVLSLVGLGLRLYIGFSPVSNFPFGMSWSESGRIYNAFQIYAPLLSIENSSWPWLDPARALLDGLVLLIPNTQIWMWRFWIEILYLASTFTTSFLIAQSSLASLSKDSDQKKVFCGILTVWGGLFLFQGPIYYHLIAGTIPVLWFYKSNRTALIPLVIALCAVWTGLTRVNWFLMPAIVASTLYILKEPIRSRNLFEYFKRPIGWGLLNLTISGVTYLWSIKFAGKPAIFGTHMTYGFSRLKLWPNDGYSLGLIPGIILITFPLAVIILHYMWHHHKGIHWIRFGFTISLLVILGAGSTVVSLRSGGGYDLHNFDTLLLIILIIGIHFGLGNVSVDRDTPYRKPTLMDTRFMSILFILPILLMISQVKPRSNYPTASSNQAIHRLNDAIIGKALDKTNCVLFIDHRHLLIYPLVAPVEIYSPYEKIELMEMAMGRNHEYLNQFWMDIENKSFDLIVSSVLWEGSKTPTDDPYWDENNVWSDYVASAINRYYQPVYLNNDVDLTIYSPKQ